jgi:hypothetical protein
LFFVRVNQVLVRLWARAIGLAVRGGVVGILTTGHRQLATDPAVWLMSDRESVSGVSKHGVFRDLRGAPLNRTVRVQRRCVY